MARRLLAAALTVGLVAGALTACGGSPSRGLVVLEEKSPDFHLRCGETANFEAAVVANAAHDPAVISALRLFDSSGSITPTGWKIAWARAYRGSIHYTAESRAKTPLLGLRILPSIVTTPEEAAVDDSGQLWHIVVGLQPPPCTPESMRASVSSRVYEFRGGSFGIDYRVGDKTHTLRLGAVATMDVCSAHPASLEKEACRR
jgi:hypothetical protein